MDSDQGKLFIGGISWDTSEEKLEEYFGNYGEISQTVIMKDKITGRPRGFGFVVFADPSILDRVLQDKHTIDGRMVEAKRALSRDEQHTSSRSGNANTGRSFGGGGNQRTKKIFVGGLPPTLTEEGFSQYFESYGHVTDVVVMYDQATQRPRGFGFISFDTEEAVDRVLQKQFHELDGKNVEVKRALPKDANPSGGGGGGRSGSSGSYQNYGSSNVQGNTYDGTRYMQPQNAGGGFPGYGSSGYGAPAGYGYGAANSGVGYGGYGGANPGYNTQASPYGNPNAGYVSGPPGGPRSPWSSQAPSGYESTGYGANAGYGNAPTGHGGYGGSDGSYGNPGGYGAVGGRGGNALNNNSIGSTGGDPQGGSGYMGSGYGDPNGSSGYPNATWRPDPSQGGSYGAAQPNVPPRGQVGYGGGAHQQ